MKELVVPTKLYNQMKTRKFWELASNKEKAEALSNAKLGEVYEGWLPYCCSPVCGGTLGRMESRPYGFRCSRCQNEIGFDLTRLKESPHNWSS